MHPHRFAEMALKIAGIRLPAGVSAGDRHAGSPAARLPLEHRDRCYSRSSVRQRQQVPARRAYPSEVADFLSPVERIYFSQVQGRTYANMFGLVERFIGAKVLELSRDHWLGDQLALEALVRFGDEELNHQALFRHVEG
jgi:hypothetical protein